MMVTMANFLFAVLFAITATKEYVDRRDEVTYTNAVKAVGGIITNHVTSGYLCTAADVDDMIVPATNTIDQAKRDREDLLVYPQGWDFSPYYSVEPSLKNQTLSIVPINGARWHNGITTNGTGQGCIGIDSTRQYVTKEDAQSAMCFTATYRIRGYAGINGITIQRDTIAKLSELNAAVGDVAGVVRCATNDVLTAATNYANAAVASITASSIGAYPAASGTTLASQVATIGAHLNAEDARFVVTNYNSATYSPEAYVEIKLPDSTWSRIWSEMTRWNWLTGTYLPTNFYTKAVVDAELSEKADRAWGYYDSTTGGYAPDGYTWISSTNVAIAADLSYQKTVTSEGAIWVLTSQGGVTDMGSATNGFFRISDDQGNSIFEIVKGDKRTLGANATNIAIVAGFSPTKMRIGYSVVSPTHPAIYVCNSLSSLNWKNETDADCLANVVWSGSSGSWIAEVQGKAAQSQLFVKAEYEVGGETCIRNRAPVSMQYIIINGDKYAVGTATISGNTVLTLTVAQ